jgi:large subunit ribosomal protein L2
MNKYLKKFQPITPSLRHTILINYKNLLGSSRLPFDGKNSLKFLTKGQKKTGGRNNYGRLTAFNIGGGHKQNYRLLSINSYHKILPFSVVTSIEYDPFRSAFISCCFMKESGSFQYILSPQNVEIGSFLISNYGLRRPNLGSSCLLYYSNIGDLFYNVNINNGPNHYRIASSAGTFCKIIKKEISLFYSILKVPSGKFRSVSLASIGFLGKTSNPYFKFKVLGKAGRSFWLGKRPIVRGVAMNPVDHPHGGGEGKSSGGRPSCTPWGFITKGQPTRRKKHSKNFTLLSIYK